MNSNKSNKESFYVDTKTMVNEDYWLNISGRMKSRERFPWAKKQSSDNRSVTRVFKPYKYDIILLYKSYTELYHCNI